MNHPPNPFKFIFCIYENANGSVTVDEHESDPGAQSVIHAHSDKGPPDYKIETWLRGSCRDSLVCGGVNWIWL